MKKQTKRWLAAVLSIMLFAISLYTDAGITASAAGTKATTVSIANLPEGNMLTLSEEKNYGQYDFDATKISGVLYWEVKKGTKTGVQSSYTGKVYPVTSGEFEIRVLAFRTRANRTKWLNARKANGYVADPKAETYVKAASDWVKITVKGEEGLAVAGTQSRLNKLLKDKNVKHIVVFTSAERDFTIGNKNYKGKTLTVNAPNADVDNQGRFAAINVAQIKDSTFRERAKGNRFHVTAPNARIIVEKGARVGAVSFQPDMKKDPDAKLNLEVNGTLTDLTVAPLNHVKGEKQAVVAVNTTENANVSGVKVEEAAILEIKGKNSSKTKVTVEESAEGTVISAEAPIAASLKASVELKLDKGASNSVVTLLKVITALIGGGEESKAENVTVKVEKEAEGAKLETVAKVEVQTEVKVEITLNEGAEGSTIVADSEVAKEIKVENQTKEEVVIKDETGEVTTTVGAGSDVQVTPVPTTAPSTGTTVPGGSTNPPSTNTPAPTAVPEDPSGIKVGKVTYTLDGKEEVKEIILTVNENPSVDENNKADAYYIGEITVPQGTRIIDVHIAEKAPYNAESRIQTFGFDSETGVVMGINGNTQMNIRILDTSQKVFPLPYPHVEILVKVKVGEDKVIPSGTPEPGELKRVYYSEITEGEMVFEKTEKNFIYRATVPGRYSVFAYAEAVGYHKGGCDFSPYTSQRSIVLYPINPDKNTVLIVNLSSELGMLIIPGTIQYTAGNVTQNLESSNFTFHETMYTYKENLSPVTIQLDKDTDRVTFKVTAANYQEGTASVGINDKEAIIEMKANSTECADFTVKIPVEITAKEISELVVTIDENPNIVTGSAIAITGSAITPVPNVKDIVDVTVSNNMATVKFKGNYKKENFETGTINIIFTATAKKGTTTLDDSKVTYEWKNGETSIENNITSTYTATIDLSKLDGEVKFSVAAVEKSSITTP